MPVSLVVTVRTESDLTDRPMGRAVQGFWLRHCLEPLRPDLSERLHDGGDLRPYSVSDLRREPDGRCWFRIASLDSELDALLKGPVFRWLCDQGDQAAWLGEPPLRFQVLGATWEARAHPWAGAASYGELVMRHEQRRPSWQLELAFVSPTSFALGRDEAGRFALPPKKQISLPFPVPELVARSWWERWNAAAPLRFGPEVCDYARLLAVAEHRLRTRYVAYPDEESLVGFTGGCRFEALAQDEAMMRALQTLADFAFFCGTGSGVARGFGLTCRGHA